MRKRCSTSAFTSIIAPSRSSAHRVPIAPPARKIMFVTHLECSLTGEHYPAGAVHNLSRAGKPLLVRYDLEAAARTLTREALESRSGGMWKWRELLPFADGMQPVSLGELDTPIVPLT